MTKSTVRPAQARAQLVDGLVHQLVQFHGPGPERLSSEAREVEQRIDQPPHQLAARAHHAEKPAPLRIQPARVRLLQHERVTVHCAQGGAQVVRHRMGERVELLVHRLQFGGFSAFTFVRLEEPRVEHAVFQQQHDQHEACRQQPVDPARIPAEVETARVENRGQRDIEEPRAHHDHEPQIEHRVRPPPPQDKQREEAQHPRARQYDAAHGSDAAALHDRGQKLVAHRGQEREPEHEGENRRNAGKNGGAGVPARSAAGRPGRFIFERGRKR